MSEQPSSAPARPAASANAEKSAEGSMRVFVKGLNWVGDAVMSTPMLNHLRTSMPEAEITLMVRPWVAAVFEHNPDIDHLWVHDDSESNGSFLAAVNRVRKGSFEIGIALPNSVRAATLLQMAGVKQRYGFKTSFGRGLLLNRAVPIAPELLKGHQVYYYLAIVEGLLGKLQGPPKQTVRAGEIEREEIAKLMRDLGLDRGQPLIGIAPGSINSTAKRWPADRFAEVADRLDSEMGATALLLGSDRESDVLDAVASHCRSRPVNLGGKIGLGQLIALMERINGFITNDSGGMHLAAALGLPTVALFGPTEWNTTYPFSSSAQIVRKEGVECAPCMLRECPIHGHPCMTGIDVQTVLTTFYAMIEKSALRRRPS